MARPKDRIDEELVCIDSLSHVLRTRLSLEVGTPQRVEAGADPPDFWLTIDGSDTAVEVTSIVQHQAFKQQASKMTQRVKELAQEANTLNGTYAIKFQRFPQIPHPTRKRDRHIYETALEYIRTTAHVSEGAEASIFKSHRGEIALKKLTAIGATVGEILVHSKWGVESEAKLRELIDLAARSKVQKLRQNGHSAKDCILAFYDAYAFHSFAEVLETSLSVPRLAEFYAVFWASAFADRKNSLYPDEPGRDGGFIASVRPGWVGVNTLRS